MNLFTITFKSLRQRRLSSSLTAVSVALGIMLMVAVLVMNSVIGDAFSQRSVAVHLVIGPKGSELANVLTAVYRVGKAGEPLPYRFLRDDLLGADSKWKDSIEFAIPMTMGDVTEEGAFPIVGTVPDYFFVEYASGRQFRLKGKGLERSFDAVIGARVARENGWDVGSEFKLVHGGASGHVHDEKFTVVGVLAPTGTANDRTVFVHMEGFYQIAGHEKPAEEAIERLKKFGYTVTPAEEAAIREAVAGHDHGHEGHDHAGHDHAGHDHGHSHKVPDDLKEISFILLKAKSGVEALMMSGAINEGVRALAVNPIKPMNQLMNDVIGNIQKLLLFLTMLIVVVAGVGIFVSIYNSMSDRRREIAIMRALGAHRGTVFLIILTESLLLCIGGGVLGLLMGHGLVFVAAPFVEAESGLTISPWQFDWVELLLFPILLVLATLIGILPGLTAYRTDVAQSLSE